MNRNTWGILLASVTVASGAAAAEVEGIDLRSNIKGNPATSRYFVIFASRPRGPMQSPAGHAFVVWATEDLLTKRRSAQSFGFYREEGQTGGIGKVPGRIVDEILNPPQPPGSLAVANRLLITEVDPDTYQRSLAVKDKWAGQKPQPPFQLTQQDCVTFTQEVAREVGLKTPRRDAGNAFPSVYVSDLMRENAVPAYGAPRPAPHPTPQPVAAPTPAAGLPPPAEEPAKTRIRLGPGGDAPEADREELLKLYKTLSAAEEHPENHYDVGLGFQGNELSHVSVRTLRARQDPDMLRGDNLCLYQTGSQRVPLETLAAALRAALELPEAGGGNEFERAFGFSPNNPYFGAPQAWSVGPHASEACYAMQASDPVYSSFMGGGPAQYALHLLRTGHPTLAKQGSVFNLRVPVSFKRQLSDAVPLKEALWRQHRSRIDHLIRLHDARATAYVGLSAAEIRNRDAYARAIRARSDQSLSFRRDYLLRGGDWDRRHQAELEKIGREDEKRVTAANERLAAIAKRNWQVNWGMANAASMAATSEREMVAQVAQWQSQTGLSLDRIEAVISRGLPLEQSVPGQPSGPQPKSSPTGAARPPSRRQGTVSGQSSRGGQQTAPSNTKEWIFFEFESPQPTSTPVIEIRRQ